MYSSSNSGSGGAPEGDRYPTQWALNPAAYQNLSNDQVDWAALAQQWIMMKETGPPEQVPPAPPPPVLSRKEVLNEGGEAPMEVENEKEDSQWPNTGGVGPPPGAVPSGSWNWQQQQWGWSGPWNEHPPAVPPPAVIPPNKVGLLPTPYPPFVPPAEGNTSTFQDSIPPNDFGSGYWTASGSKAKAAAKPPRIPRKDVHSEGTSIDAVPSIALDAAKRRQLPAWIREGLEKMEREKQKQLDKMDREKKEKEQLELKKQEEEKALQLLQTSGVLPKSKFDSESDVSDSETKDKSPPRPKSPASPPLTHEQKLQQTMVNVRKTMTEILLHVTNTEIEIICQEELNRFRSKQSASAKGQPMKPSAGSFSGPLGLDMYGGSGSSSEDSEGENSENNQDSDTQLKEIIKRRKAEFAKVEREIENKLAEVEAARDGNNRGGSTEHEHDTQVDTTQSHDSHDKLKRHPSRSHEDPATPPGPTPSRHESKRKSTSKKYKHSRSSSEYDDDDNSSSRSSSRSSSVSRRQYTKSSHSSDRKGRRFKSRSRSRSTEDAFERNHKSSSKSRRSSEKTENNHRSKYEKRSQSPSSHSSSRSKLERSKSHRSNRSHSRDSRELGNRRRSYRSRSRSYSRDRRSRSRDRRSRSRERRSKYKRSRSRSHSFDRLRSRGSKSSRRR